jgi:hypothetical protein
METPHKPGDLALVAQAHIMKIAQDNFHGIRQMDEGDFHYFINNITNLLSTVQAVAEEGIKIADARAQMREVVVARLRHLVGNESK